MRMRKRRKAETYNIVVNLDVILSMVQALPCFIVCVRRQCLAGQVQCFVASWVAGNSLFEVAEVVLFLCVDNPEYFV